MKSFLTGTVYAVLLATATVVAANPMSSDPAIGHWKLNVEKSKATPGPLPKSEIRSYSESAQGTTLTYKTIAADGKESSVSTTYKLDGRDYPVVGTAIFDTVSVKWGTDKTVEYSLKKAGKVVATGERSVSKDGKVLTTNTKSTVAGVSTESTLVFDRQ